MLVSVLSFYLLIASSIMSLIHLSIDNLAKGIGPSLLGQTVFESGYSIFSIEAKPNQTMCEQKRRTALMSIGERMYNTFEDFTSQIFRPPIEVNEFGQQRIDALLKNGKKARVFRNKVIFEAQIMQMKRKQQLVKKVEPAQQSAKPKNLRCENQSHSAKKFDLGSGHLLRSRKRSHRRGKIRRMAKSRRSSKFMDKSRTAKLNMKNEDDISCENSANNGKTVSSRKRNHRDKIRHHKSKDVILLLEAARDEMFRIKGKTLSNLARAAAKAQKAIEGLQHVVREHINSKQVKTRQLRKASKEINLVRFVFDFRAFEVPGEHEEDKTQREPKNEKKQEENSLSIPPFSITQASMTAMGKDKGSPYANDAKPVNKMVSENSKVQNRRFSLGKAKERVTSVPAYRPMPLPLLVLENLEVVRPIVPRKNECSTRSTPSVRKEKFKSEICKIKTNRVYYGTIGSFQKDNELVLGSSVKTVEDSNGSTSATVLMENIKYMSVGCAICSIRLEANEDAYGNLNQQKLT
eukprot:gene16801-8264_t